MHRQTRLADTDPVLGQPYDPDAVGPANVIANATA